MSIIFQSMEMLRTIARIVTLCRVFPDLKTSFLFKILENRINIQFLLINSNKSNAIKIYHKNI